MLVHMPVAVKVSGGGEAGGGWRAGFNVEQQATTITGQCRESESVTCRQLNDNKKNIN